MAEKTKKNGFSALMVLGIIVGVIVVSVVGTIFFARLWLFPSPFIPVVLSQQEESRLETKLVNFEKMVGSSTQDVALSVYPEKSIEGQLEPQAYSEVGAIRAITLSEREVNALLANNTNLADRFSIDFADDLVSAKMLIPVVSDFPVFGGKVLRVKAGVELTYRDSRPIVILKGVSVMGVPVPSEWLGGLKNIDVIAQYGADSGFWKSFSAGVDSIVVTDGNLHVKLKE